jgi:hypothetical protein
VWNGLKRVVFWDFPRASWQYDIIVAAIVAFVFLTPREWFHDQPRIPQAHAVALLPSAKGIKVFWLEPQLIARIPADLPEPARLARVSAILRSQFGDQSITRLEPVYDSEKEITGYMAVAKP